MSSPGRYRPRGESYRQSLSLRLKWKPPSENSIDFKLQLRFPPSRHDPSEPDYTAKPAFLLYAWQGNKRSDDYEFFDYMDVPDDEWDM